MAPTSPKPTYTAWLALIGIAYNRACWTDDAAGLGRVTTKTLRSTIIAAPDQLGHQRTAPAIAHAHQLAQGRPHPTALAIVGAVNPAPG